MVAAPTSPLAVISNLYDTYNKADGDEANGVEIYDGTLLLVENFATTDLSGSLEKINEASEDLFSESVDEQELRCGAWKAFNEAKQISKEDVYKDLDQKRAEVLRWYELSKTPRPDHTTEDALQKNGGFLSEKDLLEYADQEKADIFREFPGLIDMLAITEDRHITMKEFIENVALIVDFMIKTKPDSELSRMYSGLSKIDGVIPISQYTEAGKAAKTFMDKYGIAEDNDNVYNILLVLEALQYAPEDDAFNKSLSGILGLLNDLSLNNPNIGRAGNFDCADYEAERERQRQEEMEKLEEMFRQQTPNVKDANGVHEVPLI